MDLFLKMNEIIVYCTEIHLEFHGILTLEDDAAGARWRGGGGKRVDESQKSESALSTADVSSVPGASAGADEPFRLLWNTRFPSFSVGPWQMQMTFSR